MSRRSVKFLFWFMIVALVMACVPSLATPFPTADPNAVNTFIAATSNAAASQTAAAIPTSTLTATITPTRNTETPSPTFTSTVIFILSSPTKPATATSFVIVGGGGGSGGGSSSSDYSCRLMSVSPPNGTSVDARDDFDVTWQVSNNGVKGWDRNSTDFYYLSGSKLHQVAGYDLSKDVDPGQTINLSVDMEAPKDPGSYSTTWTLRVGSRTFCNVSLTIVVK